MRLQTFGAAVLGSALNTDVRGRKAADRAEFARRKPRRRYGDAEIVELFVARQLVLFLNERGEVLPGKFQLSSFRP